MWNIKYDKSKINKILVYFWTINQLNLKNNTQHNTILEQNKHITTNQREFIHQIVEEETNTYWRQ